MNRSIISIGVVLVVICVVATVVFLQRPMESVSIPEPQPAVRLLDVAAGQISSVHIMTHRDEFSLQRMSGNFLLSGTREVEEADQEKIAAIVSTLASLTSVGITSDETPDDEVGLGNYGLIRVTMNDGSVNELRIGDRELTGGTYAAVAYKDGSPVSPRCRIARSDYETLMQTRQDLLK